MLSRICRKPGCSTLIPIPQTYCQAHAQTKAHDTKERHRWYDSSRRDSKAAAFYKSIPWVQMQAHIINKYKGVDIYAYYSTGKTLIATMVHHIEPIKEAWTKRLDPLNLIPMTAANHNEVHRLYDRDKPGTMAKLAEMLARFRTKYGIDIM